LTIASGFVETTKDILERYRVWAVVGISDREDRAGNSVPRFLEERGYQVVPVNPSLATWRGKPAFPDLLSIPFPVDVVDLFRRSELVPPHVDEAIVHGAVKRIRPKMMTVTAAFLGLLPMLLSQGTGADMMKRVAAPMVGGLVTSFVLELLVYPPIYEIWKARSLSGTAGSLPPASAGASR